MTNRLLSLLTVLVLMLTLFAFPTTGSAQAESPSDKASDAASEPQWPKSDMNRSKVEDGYCVGRILIDGDGAVAYTSYPSATEYISVVVTLYYRYEGEVCSVTEASDGPNTPWVGLSVRPPKEHEGATVLGAEAHHLIYLGNNTSIKFTTWAPESYSLE